MQLTRRGWAVICNRRITRRGGCRVWNTNVLLCTMSTARGRTRQDGNQTDVYFCVFVLQQIHLHRPLPFFDVQELLSLARNKPQSRILCSLIYVGMRLTCSLFSALGRVCTMQWCMTVTACEVPTSVELSKINGTCICSCWFSWPLNN